MEEGLIREFLDKRNVFEVVEASRDPEKHGHRIYKDLKSAGYEVDPINPKAGGILGDRCYADIQEHPRKPDVVDFVVPPKGTENIPDTCLKLGMIRVRLQPGSECEKAIKFCQDHGIEVVRGVCVMVQRRKCVTESS